eukprot:gene11725-8070_t
MQTDNQQVRRDTYVSACLPPLPQGMATHQSLQFSPSSHEIIQYPPFFCFLTFFFSSSIISREKKKEHPDRSQLSLVFLAESESSYHATKKKVPYLPVPLPLTREYFPRNNNSNNGGTRSNQSIPKQEGIYIYIYLNKAPSSPKPNKTLSNPKNLERAAEYIPTVVNKSSFPFSRIRVFADMEYQSPTFPPALPGENELDNLTELSFEELEGYLKVASDASHHHSGKGFFGSSCGTGGGQGAKHGVHQHHHHRQRNASYSWKLMTHTHNTAALESNSPPGVTNPVVRSPSTTPSNVGMGMAPGGTAPYPHPVVSTASMSVPLPAGTTGTTGSHHQAGVSSASSSTKGSNAYFPGSLDREDRGAAAEKAAVGGGAKGAAGPNPTPVAEWAPLLFPLPDAEVVEREQRRWSQLAQESWLQQRRHLQQWDPLSLRYGALYRHQDVASQVEVKLKKTVLLVPFININPDLLCGREQDDDAHVAATISGLPGEGEAAGEGAEGSRDGVQTRSSGVEGEGFAAPQQRHGPPTAPIYMWQSISFIPGNEETILANLDERLREQYSTLAMRKLSSVSLLNQNCSDILYWARQARKEATAGLRIICHYFSRGFPRPRHHKISVLSPQHNCIQELLLRKFSSEIGFPLILVADCQDSGVLLDSFLESLRQKEERSRGSYGVMYDSPRVRHSRGPPGSPGSLKESSEGRPGNQGANGPELVQDDGISAGLPFRQSNSTTIYSGPEHLLQRGQGTGNGSDDFFFFGATGRDGKLAQHPRMPSDLLSSCLTTPLLTGMLWFMVERPDLRELHPIILHLIPGSKSPLTQPVLNDRKTPLGQLQHYFQCLTESIAWSSFPVPLYSRLFLHDLYLRPLFQGYLLAERIVVGGLAGSLSVYPQVPPTYTHAYWNSWDSAVERCCVLLMKSVHPPPPSRLTTLEFREFLDVRLAEWKFNQEIRKQHMPHAPHEVVPGSTAGTAPGAGGGPGGAGGEGQTENNELTTFQSLRTMEGNTARFPDFLEEELLSVAAMVECVTNQGFDVPHIFKSKQQIHRLHGTTTNGSPKRQRDAREVAGAAAGTGGGGGGGSFRYSRSHQNSRRGSDADVKPHQQRRGSDAYGIAPRRRHASSPYRPGHRADTEWGKEAGLFHDLTVNKILMLNETEKGWQLRRRTLPLMSRWSYHLSPQGKISFESYLTFWVDRIPVVLQCLLLERYREQALGLLCRLVDIGKEVVVQCAEANLYTVFMRLWARNDLRHLLPALLFITCKTCYVDPALVGTDKKVKNSVLDRCFEVLDSPVEYYSPTWGSAGGCASLGSTVTSLAGTPAASGGGQQQHPLGAWQVEVLGPFSTAEGQRLMASSLLSLLLLHDDESRELCHQQGRFFHACRHLHGACAEEVLLVASPSVANSNIPSSPTVRQTSSTTSTGTTFPSQNPMYAPPYWHLPGAHYSPSEHNVGHWPDTPHSIRNVQIAALIGLFFSFLHEWRQELLLASPSGDGGSLGDSTVGGTTTSTGCQFLSVAAFNETSGAFPSNPQHNFAICKGFRLALGALETLSRSVTPFLRGTAMRALGMLLLQSVLPIEARERAAEVLLGSFYRITLVPCEMSGELQMEACYAGNHLAQFLMEELRDEMELEDISEFVKAWIVKFGMDEKKWRYIPPPLLDDGDDDTENGSDMAEAARSDPDSATGSHEADREGVAHRNSAARLKDYVTFHHKKKRPGGRGEDHPLAPGSLLAAAAAEAVASSRGVVPSLASSFPKGQTLTTASSRLFTRSGAFSPFPGSTSPSQAHMGRGADRGGRVTVPGTSAADMVHPFIKNTGTSYLTVLSNVIRLLVEQAHASSRAIGLTAQRILFDQLSSLGLWRDLGKSPLAGVPGEAEPMSGHPSGGGALRHRHHHRRRSGGIGGGDGGAPSGGSSVEDGESAAGGMQEGWRRLDKARKEGSGSPTRSSPTRTLVDLYPRLPALWEGYHHHIQWEKKKRDKRRARRRRRREAAARVGEKLREGDSGRGPNLPRWNRSSLPDPLGRGGDKHRNESVVGAGSRSSAAGHHHHRSTGDHSRAAAGGVGGSAGSKGRRHGESLEAENDPLHSSRFSSAAAGQGDGNRRLSASYHSRNSSSRELPSSHVGATGAERHHHHRHHRHHRHHHHHRHGETYGSRYSSAGSFRTTTVSSSHSFSATLTSVTTDGMRTRTTGSSSSYGDFCSSSSSQRDERGESRRELLQELEDTIPAFVYANLRFLVGLVLLEDDAYDPRTPFNRSKVNALERYAAAVGDLLADAYRRNGFFFGNCGTGSTVSSAPQNPHSSTQSSPSSQRTHHHEGNDTPGLTPGSTAIRHPDLRQHFSSGTTLPRVVSQPSMPTVVSHVSLATVSSSSTMSPTREHQSSMPPTPAVTTTPPRTNRSFTVPATGPQGVGEPTAATFASRTPVSIVQHRLLPHGGGGSGNDLRQQQRVSAAGEGPTRSISLLSIGGSAGSAEAGTAELGPGISTTATLAPPVEHPYRLLVASFPLTSRYSDDASQGQPETETAHGADHTKGGRGDHKKDSHHYCDEVEDSACDSDESRESTEEAEEKERETQDSETDHHHHRSSSSQSHTHSRSGRPHHYHCQHCLHAGSGEHQTQHSSSGGGWLGAPRSSSFTGVWTGSGAMGPTSSSSGGPTSVQSLLFHPADSQLISCTSSGVIQVWCYNRLGSGAPSFLHEVSIFHVCEEENRRCRRRDREHQRYLCSCCGGCSGVPSQTAKQHPGREWGSGSPPPFTSASARRYHPHTGAGTETPPGVWHHGAGKVGAAPGTGGGLLHAEFSGSSLSSLFYSAQAPIFAGNVSPPPPGHSGSPYHPHTHQISGLHFVDASHQPLLCAVRSRGSVTLFADYASLHRRRVVQTFDTLTLEERGGRAYHHEDVGGLGSNPAADQQFASYPYHCLSDYTPESVLLYITTPDNAVSAWDLRSQYLHTSGIGAGGVGVPTVLRAHPSMPGLVGVASDMVRVYDIRCHGGKGGGSTGDVGMGGSGTAVPQRTPGLGAAMIFAPPIAADWLGGGGGLGGPGAQRASYFPMLSLDFSRRFDHLVVAGYSGPTAPVVMWDDRRGDRPLQVYPTLTPQKCSSPAMQVEVHPLRKSLLAVTLTSNALHWTTTSASSPLGGGDSGWGSGCGAGGNSPTQPIPGLSGSQTRNRYSGGGMGSWASPSSPSSSTVLLHPQPWDGRPVSPIPVHHGTTVGTGSAHTPPHHHHGTLFHSTEDLPHEVTTAMFHPFQELLAIGAGTAPAGNCSCGCRGTPSAKHRGRQHRGLAGGSILLYSRAGCGGSAVVERKRKLEIRKKNCLLWPKRSIDKTARCIYLFRRLATLYHQTS